MKKLLSIMLTLIILLNLTSCGPNISKIKGETIDIGSYTVLCPEGWTNNSKEDWWAKFQKSENTSDLINTPSIIIQKFYGDELGNDDKEKISFKAGKIEWNGYKNGENLVLLAKVNDEKFVAQVYKCDVKDVEMLASLASIKLK